MTCQTSGPSAGKYIVGINANVQLIAAYTFVKRIHLPLTDR